MSLCHRLIGGLFDGLDTITSFWQTPREVEWAKAAAASGELCDCGHRIHDSNVCPVGECLCLGWFPDRAKAHAAADRLAEREAEEEVAEPDGCTCFWTPESTWTKHYGAVEPGSQREWNPECPEHPPTSATTPGAVDGPAVGSPDKPTAVVGPNSPKWLRDLIEATEDYVGAPRGSLSSPLESVEHAAAVADFAPGGVFWYADDDLAPSAEVEPPASAPSAESPAPEFDWVTTAIPVIAGVLAEHVPWPQCNYILCLNRRMETCGEFDNWADWRNHVAPHIAVDIQSDCLTTSYDFPSGDRPRPLADFPKHQK